MSERTREELIRDNAELREKLVRLKYLVQEAADSLEGSEFGTTHTVKNALRILKKASN